MRHRPLVGFLFCVLAACGPAGGGDDGGDDEGPVDPMGDADGDTITNADEDGPDRDTDGDGTPDYRDDDSDGDGIPDATEAGDGDINTHPGDSDVDGTPDYLDDDSDGDGVLDYWETAIDYDEDGRPNYLDDDSDGDCIPDAVEGVGDPPTDSDADGRGDFADRDSDNDGLADGAEDANCNGVADAGETSATDEDTDGDGVSDLVETAAGTDPLDMGDNPQENGDFVFIVPYQQPPTPNEDDLDFSSDLVSVDVYVIVDRSGSMDDEIASVRDNLAAAIDSVQCPPLGDGDPATCIPDLWAGGGTLGYFGTDGEAFRNYADIQPNPSFTNLPTTEPAGCCDEASTFALWAAITGNGSATSGCLVSSTAARASCTGSPAANAGYGTFGYPCFRDGALPVVLLATDEAPLNSTGTEECPEWATVRTQYTNRSAKVMGILGSGVTSTVTSDLQTIATDTGAVDAANANAPLVFDGAGTNSATAIANGIRTLANGVPLDLSAEALDDPADTVDAVASFVDHLETLQLGDAQCAAGLTDQDTNADGYDDYYVDVRTGTPVCWKVVAKMNTTVPATTEPQLFRATVSVEGDGVTVLDTRDVYFLVPPENFDPPVD